MKIFLSFLPIIIASIVIGLGAILIIDDEKRHSKSAKKKNNMKEKENLKKKPKNLKIIYASKTEVEQATKKCLKKYPDVFKQLAKY